MLIRFFITRTLFFCLFIFGFIAVCLLFFQVQTKNVTVFSSGTSNRNDFWEGHAKRLEAAVKLASDPTYNIKFEEQNFDNKTGADHFVVPNIIHYVRYMRDGFTFVEYICLRSAYLRQKPDFILIHSDVPGEFKGKYWKWIKQEPDLANRIVVVPSKISNKIFDENLSEKWRFYHASDVARLRALVDFGGIYLDNDVYVVGSLDKYRKFEMTVGYPQNGTVGNMIIIANKNSRFLANWLNSYKHYRSDLWYHNAGFYPAEMLTRNAHLVHREVKRLGTDFRIMEKLYRNNLTESEIRDEYDTVHLFISHRHYLDTFFKDYRYFNERNIRHYPFTFGEMSRNVLSSHS